VKGCIQLEMDVVFNNVRDDIMIISSAFTVLAVLFRPNPTPSSRPH